MIKNRFIVFFLALLSSASLACTCDFSLGDIDDDFRKAAMVFRARIIAVDYIPYKTTLPSGRHTDTVLIRAEVQISSTYKGDTSEIIYVATDPSTCGANFMEGDDFVFFTSDIAHVHLCGGSLSVRKASAINVDWAEYVARVADLSVR